MSDSTLRAITAEGFRGIGQKATLGLTPGSGLTLVVGRRSGKSGFAALHHPKAALAAECKHLRPFLSYNELGSLLDEGPLRLYDALGKVPELDALVDPLSSGRAAPVGAVGRSAAAARGAERRSVRRSLR